MLLALCLPSVHAAVWTASEGGEWFDDANWDTTAPNGVDAIADFRFDKTDPNDFIRMSSPPTVGQMFFGNTGTSLETFLVMAGGAAGNTITFETSAGNAIMDVAADMTLNVRGGLILNSTLEKTGPGTFSSTNNFNISGTGGFVLNGGTAIFSRDNTYTGPTTIEDGELRINSARTNTSPTWTINGGFLNLQDDSGAPIENLTGSPAVTINGGSLQAFNNTETIGNLTMDSTSATTTLAIANNGAGTTPALLTVDSLDLTGTSNLVSFDVTPAPGTYDIMNATTVNGTLGTNLSISGLPASVTQTWSFIDGVVSVALSYTPKDITYTNNSTAAMWTINGDTDWTDGSPTGYIDTDNVTFDNTATGLPGTLSVDIAETVSPSSVTVDIASGNEYLFTGADISGSTGITKDGAGTLTLAQDNTFTGATLINSGAVQVGNNTDEAGSLGTSDVTVASGTFLDFNRPDTESYDNNITLNGTLSQIGSGFADLNGDITGSGDIIQSPGAATFGLDGQNNISGDISLDNGTSFIRGGGSTYSGDITLALGTELDFGSSSLAPAGDVLVTGIISGDGAVDVNLGDGEKAILTGEDTYTGTTSIGSNDTLQIGDGGTTGSLGSGDVDMDVSSSVLIFNRSNAINVANNFVLDGTIRQEGSGDLNLNGNITIDDSNGDIVTTAGTTSLNGGLTCEVDTTSGSSQTLVVTGALNLGGATLSLIETNPGTLAEGTKTTLIDYTGGSLTGTFAGLAEGATVTLGSNSFTISYVDASQVTLTALAGGYSAWATTNAGGQGPDPDLDFDGDGVPNGVEYFMGETGSSFTPNPGIVGGTITWPKDPSANATYVVEVSSNLQDEVVPGDGGWAAADPGDVVDNGTSVVYTVPTGDPRLFTRLRVIIP